MLTLALLGVVVVITIASYCDPRFGVAAILLGYAFIPFAVGAIRTGPLSLHVCTLLIAGVATARLLIRPEHLSSKYRNTLKQIPAGAVTLIAIFLLGAAATELIVTTAPATALSFFLNYIISPIVLFMLCCDLGNRYPEFYPQVARGFVAVACAQSALSFLIARGIVPQPFLGRFERRFWWPVIHDAGRQLGTTDHPLNLALMIAAAVPMVVIMRRFWVQIGALLLLFTGVALTQSRIGLLAAAAGVLYLVFVSSKTWTKRVVTTFAIVIGYFILNYVGMFAGVSGRISNDYGSTEARNNAMSSLLPRWEEFFPFGIGIENAKSYMATHLGMQTSPESAFLGYAMGFGIPLAVVFFGAMLWIAGSRIRRTHGVNPGVASMLIVLVAVQFYSSITVGMSSAAIILAVSTFLAIANPPPRPIMQSVTEAAKPVSVGSDSDAAADLAAARQV